MVVTEHLCRSGFPGKSVCAERQAEDHADETGDLLRPRVCKTPTSSVRLSWSQSPGGILHTLLAAPESLFRRVGVTHVLLCHV